MTVISNFDTFYTFGYDREPPLSDVDNLKPDLFSCNFGCVV